VRRDYVDPDQVEIGAIAMNAGRGAIYNKTIFDFVASVTVFRDGKELTLSKAEIPLDYRQTPFTGQKSDLITSVTFVFSQAEIQGSPRRERVAWSKENQDHSAANCGAVFKHCDWTLMNRLRGRGFFSARFSPKTPNWILSTGNKSWPIFWLIRLTQWSHRVLRKRAVLELIAVD
jgi:UDP-N-acetylmuramate dehydrogenase